jgi:hypothetical protein
MKYRTEEERRLAVAKRSSEYYFNNKEKCRLRNTKWHQDNKEYLRVKKRQRYLEGAVPTRIKHREQILDAYGRTCLWCGIEDVRVLDLDHARGDGAEHRKAIGGWKIYADVIARGFPDDFRLLCKNCNWLAYLEIKPPATTL